jgi:hypothetical protein
MAAIVSVETVLLVLLVVLVAGLLRSHAEILRRLETGGGPAAAGIAQPSLAPARASGGAAAPAPALAGPTPTGDAIRLDFAGGAGGPILLAFLTSGCGTCAGFWETLGEPRLPPGVRTVVVTHGSERERPAALRSLAPPGVPVVMSSEAWADYLVPGAPYFVLVNGAIRGEGAATTWQGLSSLVSDAIEDQHEAGGTARAGAAERKLAAAGKSRPPDDSGGVGLGRARMASAGRMSELLGLGCAAAAVAAVRAAWSP